MKDSPRVKVLHPLRPLSRYDRWREQLQNDPLLADVPALKKLELEIAIDRNESLCEIATLLSLNPPMKEVLRPVA